MFSSAKGPECEKRHNDVLMTSNCKFMLLFELCGPNLVSIPNFSSISLKIADFLFMDHPKDDLGVCAIDLSRHCSDDVLL